MIYRYGLLLKTAVLILGSDNVSIASGLIPLPTTVAFASTGIGTSTARSTTTTTRPCTQIASTSESGQEPVKLPSQELKALKVVVVGGGVGGLAVASRIAASTTKNNINCHVTILEKNSEIGGRCGSFTVDIPSIGTFRHERGPSLLLLPDIYREIFQDCSTKSAETFGLVMAPCVPAYQVVFEDGDSIEVGFPHDNTNGSSSGITDGSISMQESKSRATMDTYEENGATKWDEYMQAMSAFLDCGLPNFIEEKFDLFSFPAFLYEALRDYAKAWPLKPHSDVLDAIFESEKMKALASFQDLYVGLEPYRNHGLLGGGVLKSTAPAVFGLLAAIELHPTNSKGGVFAPTGGFQAVSMALKKMAQSELGVDIQCGKTVTAVHNGGVYTRDTEEDIETDGTRGKDSFVPADLIIVNADLPYATKSLIVPPDKSTSKAQEEREEERIPSPPLSGPRFDWDDSFDFSSGVIAFHWAIGKVLDDLNTHNVFLVTGSRSQAEASWEILRTNRGDLHSDDDGNDPPFNFYVHRASKTDPTAAPDGCDSIMVLVPCKTLLRDEGCASLPLQAAMKQYRRQFSDHVISETRKAVLKRLAAIDSLVDLQDHILDEVVDTPATYADQYHLAAGTPFALSHGFGQLSITRPGPMSSIPNVLFCGASSRPGNGVPLVLVGAKQVAQKATRILQRQLQEEKQHQEELSKTQVE